MDTYEKKYKESMAKMSTFLAKYDGFTISKDGEMYKELSEIFPELKESEDEKIRKELIGFLRNIPNSNYTCEEMALWLEKQGKQKQDPCNNCKDVRLNCHNFPCTKKRAFKQGKSVLEVIKEEQVDNANKVEQKIVPDWMPKFLDELRSKKNYFDWDEHRDIEGGILAIIKWMNPNYFNGKDDGRKPADKVEPKFKNGQWIVWQDKCYKVNYNGCGYELVDQNGLSTSLEYGTVDESAHLWDITKDAKDGDVLVSGQITILFKKFEEDSDYNFVIAYAGIDVSGKLQITDGNWLISNDAKPATKEQRDTLLKAMADAGYTFDFEKKELKKIEQTSNKWNEEDENIALSIEQVMNCASLLNIVPEKMDKIKTWLKSLKERVQPKQEWSEEDEKREKEELQRLKKKYEKW